MIYFLAQIENFTLHKLIHHIKDLAKGVNQNMGRLSKRSKAARLAWAKRRDGVEEEPRQKRKYTRRKFATKESAVRSVVARPEFRETPQIALSSCEYSPEQVKDVGFFAVSDNGKSFRFLKVNGDWVRAEVASLQPSTQPAKEQVEEESAEE